MISKRCFLQGWICVTSLLLLFTAPTVPAADEGHWRRWAVLAAPEIRESGMSDLLTAELSSRKEFELVEREQLDAVSREIELSKLLGADAASQRLKVGQLVKADALVLLSLVENDKKKFVKLVISDCRYGSRLRLDHFPFAADSVERIAQDVAGAVQETRQRFAHGVERIVAVSPFLSKNLTHEFDHLQFGFAALLGQGLSERPGVAVLEIEEARAVGEELTRATSELNRRAVPIFVESEFEIAERTATDRAGSVRFVIRLRSGQTQSKTIEHTGPTLDEASSWLIESLPNKIAEQETAAGTKPLTRVQQCEALTHRADQFVQIAAYPESAAMREAALLLQPDHWEQRVLLIADLTRRINQMVVGGSSEQTWNKLRVDAEFKRRYVAEMHSLIAGIEGHTDRVLADGVLNPREANQLLGPVTHLTTIVVNKDEPQLGLRPQFRDFYWRSLTRAVRLDPRVRNGGLHPVFVTAFGGVGSQKETPLFEQHNDVVGRAVNYLIDSMPMIQPVNRPPQYEDADTIRYLERLFEEVLLPDVFSASVLHCLTRGGKGSVSGLVVSKRIPAAKVVALFERWRATQQPLLEFYARAGLLALKANGAVTEAVTEADLAEADWLVAFTVEWQKQRPNELNIGGIGKQFVSELRKSLVLAVPKGAGRKVARPVVLHLEGTDPHPRLAFEPLDMTATWTSLSPCGAGRDLVWSWESVGLLTAPGQLKTIYKVVNDPTLRLLNDKDSICSVVWDGEFLWVAGSRSGVRVFNLEGTPLGQLLPSSETEKPATAETNLLPPVDPQTTFETRGIFTMTVNRSLWLHPLTPGRCFVSGRFGKDQRRWFGVIEREPASGDRPSWKFTRWHQLTKQQNANGADDDLDAIFTPSFVTDYVDPADQSRWLLVGRRSFDSGGAARRPLAFPVATGQPTLFRQALHVPFGGSFDLRPVAIGDNLLFTGQDAIARIDLADSKAILAAQPLAKRKFKPAVPGQPRTVMDRYTTLRPQLLPIGEWLYNPGVHWQRINTRSWQVEPLTTSLVSLRYEFENYAVSAHYGLVAWNHGDALNRVHVDPPSDEPRPLSWLYPFVPADARERHHRAVEEIRRLGGQVDTIPREAKRSSIRRTELWRTVVWLTDAWQGGDDGLRHLADLHNLRELFLERALITDDGLKTVSQFKTLNILHVVETKATSAGVQLLATLPELSHLWLENAANSTQIGDEALTAFRDKPKLFELTLVGASFTDQSLSYVLAIPRLFQLRLIDTNTTPAAITTTKQKRPGLQFLSETNQ